MYKDVHCSIVYNNEKLDWLNISYFLGGTVLKNLPASEETQEMWVSYLSFRSITWENDNPFQYSCLESSVDRLQSTGSQRARHNWACTHIISVYHGREIHGSCVIRLLRAVFSSVQLLSHVQLWTAARQASLSITNSWSLPKLMSIEWVIPSNHLILCHPLLLLPSIFPSIRVSSKESVRIRWAKY